MKFTTAEKIVGLVVLIMIIIMVTGCTTRHYPKPPVYDTVIVIEGTE